VFGRQDGAKKSAVLFLMAFESGPGSANRTWITTLILTDAFSLLPSPTWQLRLSVLFLGAALTSYFEGGLSLLSGPRRPHADPFSYPFLGTISRARSKFNKTIDILSG
jgi:hypothetical protein